jgi:hypothetical protein
MPEYEVIAISTGQAGLATGHPLRTTGLSCTLLEAGELAWALGSPGHQAQAFSPFPAARHRVPSGWMPLLLTRVAAREGLVFPPGRATAQPASVGVPASQPLPVEEWKL